jgi:chemotaxis signal transduction protein
MLDTLVQDQEFQIDSELAKYIRYMYGLQKSKDELQNLSKRWDMLALLSQLGSEGVNVREIKDNFTKLSNNLINFLGMEQLNKYSDIMDSKASIAVDIVIRNLFERTADIGFLATDGEIRKFIKSFGSKYESGFDESREILRKRFEEYVAKYSVYYDVVLLNPTGTVLARLDKDNTVSKSHDEIIKETLNSTQAYVESFKYHDFIPDRPNSLVYSYKVTANDDVDSEVIGVLALCFRFRDEMASIFSNLVNPDTKECITLLDKDGSVIATSDENHIPRGVKLEMVLEKDRQIVTFGGRDYMAKTKSTQGYQGFFGLGWYGHIMIPLDYAFEKEDELSHGLTEEFLLSILQNGKGFKQSLKDIPIQASSIQVNLNRAIYNGRLTQSSSQTGDRHFAKSLLQEIGQSGSKTNNIVSKSIANLTQTMVLGNSSSTAALIIDIMDRNLYERANDCRWWALTPKFKEVLNKPMVSPTETKDMSKILEHINSLYTVYTLLFIYDTNGKVVAISNADYEWLLNTRLSNDWVSECLAIKDTNEYTVSKFEETALYDNEHTYIYNAPILDDNKTSIGGIGVVFDSTIEFNTMIEESTPDNKEKEPIDGAFAVICEPNGMIVSSNESSHKVGEYLNIDPKFFDLKNGKHLDEIVEYKDRYYALGVVCSKGYREYKSKKDTYSNDLLTFYFSYICDADDIVIKENRKFFMKRADDLVLKDHGEESVDIASFYIADKWFGIDAADVVEVIDVKHIESSVDLDSDQPYKGSLIYENNLVGVIDIKQFIQKDVIDEYEEVVIVRFEGSSDYMGILVNSLGDIPEVAKSRLKSVDQTLINNGTLIKGIVAPETRNNNAKLLTILDIDKLRNEIVETKNTDNLKYA